MLAHVAHRAFEPVGHVHDFLRVLVLGNEVAQLLFTVHRLGQRHADLERNQFREPVGKSERLALHPRHVAHHGLRGHRAEGDDLAHRVVAVEFSDVVQDFLAAFHAEVDVEVRHGNALGIEQAFEQQIVAQRIEVGDVQTEGHERRRAGTPAAHWNTVVAGPVDELLDDEEIPREAHLVDDAKLVVHARPVARHVHIAIGPGQILEMAFQAGAGALIEQGFLGAILGHRRMREMVLAQLDFAAASLGDLHCVFKGFGQIGEQRQHLVGAAQVLLLAVAPFAARVVQHAAFLDADPGLVRFEVVPVEETDIVGGHQGNALPGRKLHRVEDERVVSRTPCAHHLEVDPVAKRTLPRRQALSGRLLVPPSQSGADIAAGADQDDQALRGVQDGLAGHPTMGRRAIRRRQFTLPRRRRIGCRHETQQVPVPGCGSHQDPADAGPLPRNPRSRGRHRPGP